MEPFNSGEVKKIFRHISCCPHWSDSKWKACLAGGGGNKKRIQYCTDDSGTIVYLRALQGHSGRNLINPSLQDNVIIQSNFCQYIYHVGCAFNLHSIINSGLIPGGQSSSKRQTVFFLPIDPRDKEHQDPEKIDLSVPRRAQYLHNAWKKHQDAVYWVDINFAIRKGLTFYQTRSNAIILPSSLLYSESCSDGNWRSLIRKSFHVTSASTKDLTTSRMDTRIGFESCSTTRRVNCSTTRRRSCSTNQVFPINPTNSKSNS